MNHMDDSKGTPSKTTNNTNETNYDFNNRDTSEIEQPNQSNATPDIPDEMPARETK